jgi:three-Cys-motif partner protein
MSQIDETFFDAKRTWSQIKDDSLSDYLAVYVTKVATLGKQIVLIDGFAGPGKYKDGSVGSPVLIVDAAELRAAGNYRAIFVNKNEEHHKALTELMQPYIDKGRVLTIHGTAADLLQQLAKTVRDQTLFIYLDPFGLAGCEFNVLAPFLERTRGSTEIFLNLQRQMIPRLACATAEANGLMTNQIDALQRRLSRVMGSSFWRGVFATRGLTSEERVTLVVEEYKKRIAKYFAYTASCPVREIEDGAIKYELMLFSHRIDAIDVMNDAACKAYNVNMHLQRVRGTLFEGSKWDEERDLSRLKPAILESLRRVGPSSRLTLWRAFVQGHFMQYLSKEYRNAVADLVESHEIEWVDGRGTGRLNDDATLFFKDAPPPISVDRIVPSASTIKRLKDKGRLGEYVGRASRTTRARQEDDRPPLKSVRPTA